MPWTTQHTHRLPRIPGRWAAAVMCRTETAWWCSKRVARTSALPRMTTSAGRWGDVESLCLPRWTCHFLRSHRTVDPGRQDEVHVKKQTNKQTNTHTHTHTHRTKLVKEIINVIQKCILKKGICSIFIRPFCLVNGLTLKFTSLLMLLGLLTYLHSGL